METIGYCLRCGRVSEEEYCSHCDREMYRREVVAETRLALRQVMRFAPVEAQRALTHDGMRRAYARKLARVLNLFFGLEAVDFEAPIMRDTSGDGGSDWEYDKRLYERGLA